jgi:hypothetical protein
MTDEAAKKHLRSMLEQFTVGSVLHLLAEVVAEAVGTDDASRVEQRRAVGQALFVVGLGVDAALPR